MPSFGTAGAAGMDRGAHQSAPEQTHDARGATAGSEAGRRPQVEPSSYSGVGGRSGIGMGVSLNVPLDVSTQMALMKQCSNLSDLPKFNNTEANYSKAERVREWKLAVEENCGASPCIQGILAVVLDGR